MNQPTAEGPPPDYFASSDQYPLLDPDDPDADARPWYRKPVTLIGWALLVLILLGLITYGVMQLLGGDKSSTPAPSTTSTTTPTTQSTTATTTTEPTTTTATTTPSPAAPAPPANPHRSQPPATQPTQSPTHHHLPPLPSTITVPGGPTITLPPGLPH